MRTAICLVETYEERLGLITELSKLRILVVQVASKVGGQKCEMRASEK